MPVCTKIDQYTHVYVIVHFYSNRPKQRTRKHGESLCTPAVEDNIWIHEL